MSCAPPDVRAPLDPGSPGEDALAAAYVRGRDDERRLRPIYVPVCRDCGAEVERGQPCKAVGCPPYAAAAPVREIGAPLADFASMHDADTRPHRPDPISLGERGPWDEEDRMLDALEKGEEKK